MHEQRTSRKASEVAACSPSWIPCNCPVQLPLANVVGHEGLASACSARGYGDRRGVGSARECDRRGSAKVCSAHVRQRGSAWPL